MSDIMKIPATRITPFVNIDLSIGKVTLKGRSSPEDSRTFYYPIIDHLRANESLIQNITVDIDLEYFNTNSCSCLMKLFRAFKEMERSGHDVAVNWHVEKEDLDLVEAGEDFSQLAGLKFNFVYFTY